MTYYTNTGRKTPDRTDLDKNRHQSVIAVSNYWPISWLTRHSLMESIRQNWLRQESTSVITLNDYWAISWLTTHSLVENIRQNWLGQEPTSVITVSNNWVYHDQTDI